MLRRIAVWGAWFVLCVLVAHAQQFLTVKLEDGTVFNARPISFRDTGVQFALEVGGYTNISWGRLSQETLREIEKINNPEAKRAAIFFDPPPSRPASATRRAIQVKPPPRLERPSDGSLFGSPVMVVLLLIVYAANIYAAYEISLFRQQPPALVCVAAAIFPVIAPALFLAIPPRAAPEDEVPLAAAETPAHTEEHPAPVDETASGSAQPEQAAAPQTVVYPRGQFTFNRRFFETKFAGFLKMVPGEAERDKDVFIKCARGEYVGQRISKIEPNELYLQVRKGAASEDVMIPFSEIYEVQIKPREA